VYLTGAQGIGHGGRSVYDDVGCARHERRVLVARWLTFRGVDDHHGPTTGSGGQLDGKGESGTSAAAQVHVAGHLDQRLGTWPGSRPQPVAVRHKARTLRDPGK